MHSTHFIYGYMASDTWLRTILIVRKENSRRKEENILFNDALNTFYLRLYGVIQIAERKPAAATWATLSD